jgi:hypothetical protein
VTTDAETAVTALYQHRAQQYLPSPVTRISHTHVFVPGTFLFMLRAAERAQRGVPPVDRLVPGRGGRRVQGAAGGRPAAGQARSR